MRRGIGALKRNIEERERERERCYPVSNGIGAVKRNIRERRLNKTIKNFILGSVRVVRGHQMM